MIHTAFRIFPTLEDALAVAIPAQHEDPDWTYSPQQLPSGRYVVAIHDEDGFHVGNHP